MATLKSASSQQANQIVNANPSGSGRSELQPTTDVVQYLRQYATEKPDVAALWCLGLGIIIGWKIKPW